MSLKTTLIAATVYIFVISYLGAMLAVATAGAR